MPRQTANCIVPICRDAHGRGYASAGGGALNQWSRRFSASADACARADWLLEILGVEKLQTGHPAGSIPYFPHHFKLPPHHAPRSKVSSTVIPS